MSNQPPLLPSDHYLMQVLAESGVEITEDDWREYKAEIARRAAAAPRPAIVAGTGAETLAIISLVTTLLSVGLTIVASFFKPKAGGRPGQLKANQAGEKAINSQRRYAPRSGFDAVQEPASIGTTIPIVYTLRETYGGGTYGGVRINMPLLWSQIQSYGGHQMLRAVFLLSEGRINDIDPRNFAIGNNAIGGYDFLSNAANQIGSRLTIYLSRDGGRILSSDRILGRSAANDAGNATNSGGQDVFAIEMGGVWTQNFCSASKPSTQTTFGLFSMIGNNLAYRVNPTLRPTVNAQLVPKGDNGNGKVVCDIDQAASAQRAKFSAIFSTRSGLTSGSVGSVGSQIRYTLHRSSDYDTKFTTEISLESWTSSVELLDQDLIDYRVFNDVVPGLEASRVILEMERWIVVQSLTYNATTKRVEIDLRFRENAARNYLINEATVDTDGVYKIKYAIKVRNTNNTKEEMETDLVIKVKRKTKNNVTNSGGSAPSVTYDTNGFVVGFNAGSYPALAQSEEITFKFNPIDATLSMKYLAGKPAVEKSTDVAVSIAGRQKTWDDAIVIGDLYKIGSALAVCVDRNPNTALFESEADFLPAAGGQTVEAVFQTIRPGQASVTPLADLRVAANAEIQPPRATATSGPHLYRIAIGNVSTSRPCRAVEIGIRSSLGIRISNLCNFSEAKTYEEINADACLSKEGDTVKKGTTLKVDIYQSGTITSAEERYSFFRISYREAGTGNAFTEFPQCYGVRSITQQSVYNAIQFRMPDIRQWEFRFEPLSGWEIRSGVAGGALLLLDSKLTSTQVITFNGAQIRFRGKTLSRNRQTFQLPTTRRENQNSDIGIGFTDEASYVDMWGKLAEAYPYEELQSSAANGPEHEITYVNEIVPNATVPLYNNLALVGLNIRSSAEFAQFSQFSAYVTAGVSCRRLLQANSVGPTHLFPDVLLDLLTNQRYGRGDLISDELIDIASFRESAQWCQDRGYFFDGTLVSRENLRQWAADTAAAHLLIFGEANGRFFLRPAMPSGVIPINGLFTAGNIRDGSFSMQYLEAEERQNIQISVRYREERATSNLTNPGLFPVEREILIREGTTLDTAPIESLDLSDFCTNPQHAIDAAKYIVRFRRLSTHAIRFDTTYEGLVTSLAPGDFIRVAMDHNVYDEFNNGIVTSEGALVSTQPLSDGTYNVIQWNGDNNVTVTSGTLNVSGGGTRATPTGIVFTVQRAGTDVQTYQVESIESNPDGYLTIEAVHAPTNAAGELRLAANFAVNWSIQR